MKSSISNQELNNASQVKETDFFFNLTEIDWEVEEFNDTDLNAFVEIYADNRIVSTLNLTSDHFDKKPVQVVCTATNPLGSSQKTFSLHYRKSTFRTQRWSIAADWNSQHRRSQGAKEAMPP